MEPLEPLQLPLRLQLAPQESGLGFALRAFRANGVDFGRGMKWLGLERHRPVDRSALRLMAWALNVDADQWGARVVMRDPGAKGWVRLAGQRMRRQIASNRLYAKVCPQCIREHGIARTSWLLRAAVGCPWHGYSLIWVCPRCRNGIAWDRPDIDICRCGHPFKALPALPLAAGVAAWLRWLEFALSPVDQALVVPSGPERLPVALTHLSIDGAFRIIEAMGLCERPSSSVRGALAQCATPPGLGGVIERGIERLRAIEADPASAQQFLELAHHQALAQLARDYATEPDQVLAWWLLSSFKGGFDSGGTRAGIRPQGQLPLFLI